MEFIDSKLRISSLSRRAEEFRLYSAQLARQFDLAVTSTEKAMIARQFDKALKASHAMHFLLETLERKRIDD